MIFRISLIVSLFVLVQACSYSFTGASIAPGTETFSVATFRNSAPLINPTLSSTFTEKLRDKILNNTSLDPVQNQGDVSFDGEIVNYKTQPSSIQGNQTAAQNRLTISIQVRYTNAKDPKGGFEETFTRFADYPREQDLAQVENGLIEQITDEIVNDIFLKAFANW